MSKLIRRGRPPCFAPEWSFKRPQPPHWSDRSVAALELGPVTTVNMATAGYKTLADVAAATNAELIKNVLRVGVVTVEDKIRPRMKRWSWEPNEKA